MTTILKEFKGCYSVTPNTEPDVTVIFEISNHANINQIINLTSIHGQNKKAIKSIGLSLRDVVDLKNVLQELIDNSPTILAESLILTL